MKVAYVCMDPGVPVFGYKGCSIHVQEVIRSLLRHGAHVDLFTCRSGGKIPESLKAVRVHELPIPKCKPAEREQLSIAANGDLLNTLECEAPYDLIYERYSIWSYAGMEYALESRVPGILEVNAPLIEEQAKHRDLVHSSMAQKVALRIFYAASILIAVSQGVAKYLNGYRVVEGKVHVIPNGVNPDRFSGIVKSSRSASSEQFTVGFVGTLKPWHDLITLLDAFSQLHLKDPNTKLLIVGDGPERERLENHVVSSDIVDSVVFTGAVAPSEIPVLLSSMDVAVAPYANLENFYFSPLKVFEYMAAGLPVVASKIGQLMELIQDGKNGILIPPGDVDAMAEVFDRLRCNTDFRKLMGQEARNCVLSNYTWDIQVERILDLSKHNMNQCQHN